jgi:hypothetical protein
MTLVCFTPENPSGHCVRIVEGTYKNFINMISYDLIFIPDFMKMNQCIQKLFVFVFVQHALPYKPTFLLETSPKGREVI